MILTGDNYSVGGEPCLAAIFVQQKYHKHSASAERPAMTRPNDNDRHNKNIRDFDHTALGTLITNHSGDINSTSNAVHLRV